jgi:hypothetical protein
VAEEMPGLSHVFGRPWVCFPSQIERHGCYSRLEPSLTINDSVILISTFRLMTLTKFSTSKNPTSQSADILRSMRLLTLLLSGLYGGGTPFIAWTGDWHYMCLPT